MPTLWRWLAKARLYSLANRTRSYKGQSRWAQAHPKAAELAAHVYQTGTGDPNGAHVGYPPNLAAVVPVVAGPQGAPGAVGAAGPQGVQGIPGVAGPIGQTGPAGPQGPLGMTGAQGPQGLPGVAGFVGPQGIQGLTGPAGAVGPIGPTGLQGIQGLIGPAGAVGPPGPAGQTGATGQTGPPGAGTNDGTVAVTATTDGSDPVAAKNTAVNQVLNVGPAVGAHNTVLPLTSGTAIHDRVPGYEGDRYRNCLNQPKMHDLRVADGSPCRWNHYTFDSQAGDTFGEQMGEVNSLYSYGASSNYSGNWTVTSLRQDHQITANRGIAGGWNLFYQKNAMGDSNVLNLYSWFDAGWVDQSGEAMTGVRNYVQQMPLYYHGTSLSAGTGLTLPSLSDYIGPAPASGATYDPNHTIDGGILLDITKGTLAGTVTGPSAPLAGSGYLNSSPVSVSGGLPVTTAWGVCPLAIPNSYQPQVNVPFTCVVTLQAGTFTAGGLVWVAGPNYPEQAPITAVGAVTTSGGVRSQSITISVRNPQPTPGANIFQGGLQGQYLSFDSNLAFSSIRSTYYAFGSLDGVSLIWGFFIAGGSALMPDCGAQAFCAGVTGRNGFHLYPGAEIVANLSIHHDVQLEPNGMTIAAGDQMEGPPNVSVSMTGFKEQCSLSTPANGGGAVCDYVGVAGPGLNGNFYPHLTSNFNDPAIYANNGGYLSGMTMHRIRGYFDFGESFDIMPGRGLFNVSNMSYQQAAGLGQFTGTNSGVLFNLPHGNVNWDDLHARMNTANLGSLTYIGPATAPTGSGTAANSGEWEFSQDGAASYCNPTIGSPCTWTQPFAPRPSVWPCHPEFSGGPSVIPAGSYSPACYNDTAETVTISGIKCYTDAGTGSTLTVANSTGTAFLASALTCSSTYAAGTLGGTVTLTPNDYLVLTFTADGIAKQANVVITGSRP